MTNEPDLHNLAVHDGEQVAQWLYTSLVDKELDLLSRATTGCIGDGPGCLFPRLELGLALDVDKNRENVGIDHGLKYKLLLFDIRPLFSNSFHFSKMQMCTPYSVF